MSSAVGRAMLADAHKELSVAWTRARDAWNDSAARAYEERYLEPLGPKIRATLSAMEKLSDATSAARRACSE